MPTSIWSMMNSSPGSPWAARRASSAVCGWSGPSEMLPSRTGVPSRLCASIVARSGAVRVADAWTSSPSTTIVRKWLLTQPRSNHAWPHSSTPSGSNWLKWVGPSIGAPARSSDAAVSASWTLGRPSLDWSWSICTGRRQGPVRVIGVSKATMRGTLRRARAALRSRAAPAPRRAFGTDRVSGPSWRIALDVPPRNRRSASAPLVELVLHHRAAVDVPRLPRHPRPLVGAQVHDGVRDVVAGAGTAHRDAGGHELVPHLTAAEVVHP